MLQIFTPLGAVHTVDFSADSMQILVWNFGMNSVRILHRKHGELIDMSLISAWILCRKIHHGNSPLGYAHTFSNQLQVCGKKVTSRWSGFYSVAKFIAIGADIMQTRCGKSLQICSMCTFNIYNTWILQLKIYERTLNVLVIQVAFNYLEQPLLALLGERRVH